MNGLINILQISIAAVLVQNLVLARFLGLCPFLGVSKKLSSATGMGMAVIFVMTVASMFTWVIHNYILIPMDVAYLQTIVFILVIASLVQLLEMSLQKFSPALYEALGIFLPLITTNCAILGVAVLNTGINEFTGNSFTFIESLVNGIASGVGFTLALVLMAGVREKLELANTPKALEGLPAAFLVGGLMALAFLGFSGLNFFASVGG
ncbi:RnfABCDGE type electron transport complex subunit A [Chitinispirillales bacterium ANBcel5]|uniref:electron transport complex protein RnfA n=1 Tax=Cellulosispirillum alkaliphilum TaxID=3039283 RepID=UPI002A5360E0|nr:RnfABCDGE type electron transport complex subunit A [Chitinispirillales bacterium ANBcel5]